MAKVHFANYFLTAEFSQAGSGGGRLSGECLVSASLARGGVGWTGTGPSPRAAEARPSPAWLGLK